MTLFPRAEQTFGIDQGVSATDFCSIDEFHFNAHAGRHANEVPVGINLIRGMCQAHAAGDMVGNWILGIGGEFAVKIDIVPFERDHGLVATKLGNLCSRMPG